MADNRRFKGRSSINLGALLGGQITANPAVNLVGPTPEGTPLGKGELPYKGNNFFSQLEADRLNADYFAKDLAHRTQLSRQTQAEKDLALQRYNLAQQAAEAEDFRGVASRFNVVPTKENIDLVNKLLTNPSIQNALSSLGLSTKQNTFEGDKIDVTRDAVLRQLGAESEVGALTAEDTLGDIAQILQNNQSLRRLVVPEAEAKVRQLELMPIQGPVYDTSVGGIVADVPLTPEQIMLRQAMGFGTGPVDPNTGLPFVKKGQGTASQSTTQEQPSVAHTPNVMTRPMPSIPKPSVDIPSSWPVEPIENSMNRLRIGMQATNPVMKETNLKLSPELIEAIKLLQLTNQPAQ